VRGLVRLLVIVAEHDTQMPLIAGAVSGMEAMRE